MSLFNIIDLETLGRTSKSAIIAIGSVFFTETEILETTEILIHPELAVGEREPETIYDFWNNPTKVHPEVKARMWSGTLTPTVAAKQLSTFLRGRSELDRFWGNSPAFDQGNLQYLYSQVGVPYPGGPYWLEGDFRTLKWLVRDYLKLKIKIPERQTERHAALDDAIYEAEVIQALLKGLKQLS